MTELFKELITKRCEEVLLSDRGYQKINQKIINLEKKIKATLTEEQLDIYNQIEEAVIELSSHENEIVYCTAYSDRLADK